MQEPVEDDATKQETSSLTSVKQEAPDAIAVGAATGNKVVNSEYTAMSAAPSDKSFNCAVLQEYCVLQLAAFRKLSNSSEWILYAMRRYATGDCHQENQQYWLNSMVTSCLQGIHGHAHRVRQSSAAEQSHMLKISFQSIAAGLNAGSYQSQEVVKQDIQEICRSAAEAFSSQDQVCLCVDPQFMTVINCLSQCCPTSAGNRTFTRLAVANALSSSNLQCRSTYTLLVM